MPLAMPPMLAGSYQLKDQQAMNAVVAKALQCGVWGFDTSPSYGTEEMLGKALASCGTPRQDLFAQTKIDAWQMIRGKGNVRPYVEAALKKMGLDYLDALLIHWPLPEYLVQTWKCFEQLQAEGIVRHIGVCNCKARHIKAIMDGGATVQPAIVQNEIHPIHTDETETAKLQAMGIEVQSYSPLARMLPEVAQSPVLAAIGKRHDRSVAQVMLRWHVQRGLAPVVKTSTPARMEENSAALRFELTEQEMEEISNLDQNVKIFLESRCCPGY